MNILLENAQKIGKLVENNPKLLEMEIYEAQEFLPENKNANLLTEERKKLADKFKI